MYKFHQTKRFLFVLGVIFSCFPHVNANELVPQTPEAENYFYVGAKAGTMYYQNACEDWNLGCDGNDAAYGLFTGYQLSQHFAFEAAYLDLGEATAIYPESTGNEAYVGSMTAIELSVLARININKYWDMTAKLGTFSWQGNNQGPYTKRSDSGWAPMAGVGLEYRLSPAWIARLEYQYIDKLGSDSIGGSNGHLATLGISYRFGLNTLPPASSPAVAPTNLPTAIRTEPASVAPTHPELRTVIRFNFDSSQITETSDLRKALDILQDTSARVQLSGYTDQLGSTEYNMALSKRRALAVVNYLTANGVSAQQIDWQAFGETSPVAANTLSSRYLNRRVELLIPAFTPTSALDANH